MIELNKAKEALANGLAQYGLQTDIEIVDVKHGHVIVLGFSQDPNMPNVAHSLIKVERYMKAYLDVLQLELQCEALSDRNKRDAKSGRAIPKLVSARGIESLD